MAHVSSWSWPTCGRPVWSFLDWPRRWDYPEAVGSDAAATLVPVLSGRRVLVVLDNLEHLLGCAPVVADLVTRCPDLIVLATSRAPLRIRAEHEVVVSPLDVPAVGASLDLVRSSPAVSMFLERSAATGTQLAVTADNADTIGAICRRLGGLPLALELAAAGSRLLTPAALLVHLDETLSVGGIRDLPDRQQTMRATLEWSYNLLQDPERLLFARLAVFSGGFSLEAAEAIEMGGDVVACLGALLDQSLVLRAPSADEFPRFRLLEPVRQYAAEQLHTTDQAKVASDRHAGYYLSVARAARPQLRGAALIPCLDRLERDHANLRSAFLRLLETDRPEDAAAMGSDIWLYLALRGHVREATTWMEGLTRLRLGDRGRCLALGAAAGLFYVSGDIPRMREYADDAVALARRLRDDELIAETAILCGSAAVFALDLDHASPVLDEALARAEDAGLDWARAHAVLAKGQLALLGGDVDEAGRLFEIAETIARRLGNAFTLATALNLLATVTELTGDYRRTALLVTEATRASVEAPQQLDARIRAAGARRGGRPPRRDADRGSPLWCIGFSFGDSLGRPGIPGLSSHVRARPFDRTGPARRSHLRPFLGCRQGIELGRDRRPGRRAQSARTRLM